MPNLAVNRSLQNCNDLGITTPKSLPATGQFLIKLLLVITAFVMLPLMVARVNLEIAAELIKT
jgi:hypothetical protein